MPPESCAGQCFRKSFSPTASSDLRARSSCPALVTPWNTMPSLTFSITEHHGNSAFSWNTKAISRGNGARTTLPPTSTTPRIGISSPPIMLSSVLLPHPLGPIRQSNSPRWMSRLVLSSARTWNASPGSPNSCETSLIRTATLPGVMPGRLPQPRCAPLLPRGVIANWRQLHAVVAPALVPRGFADQPAGDRAHRRDPDLLALEIVECLDRIVIAYHQREGQRRVGHRGDALHRRALHDEGEPRTRAEPDVDAVGSHSLLHAGVAAEAGNRDVDAVLLEQAGLRADVGRHERERVSASLADAQGLSSGARRSDERAGKRQRQCSDHRCFLPLAATGRSGGFLDFWGLPRRADFSRSRSRRVAV